MIGNKRKWIRRVVVLVIFLAGLGLRLYDLQDAPLDFHATRQLHSALIARGMFYQHRPDLLPWKQDMALQQWRSEGQIEPLVMENLAVWSYRLAGGAYLWIPRLWAIAFWMAAAVMLFKLALDLMGWVGALVALSFFLIWPYGVIASRSFQPESLQVAAIAAALWAAFRWQARVAAQQPSTGVAGQAAWFSPAERWAILSGLLAGLAIYVKLTSIFFLALPLAVLAWQNGRGFRDRAVWIMAVLALLPAGLYHLDGLFIRGFLRSQVTGRLYPGMWLDPAFYLRWISVLERIAPFNLVLAGIMGNLLVDDRRRPALMAIWAGYGIYGLAFPHHISTHDYYHLVLLVPLSLGLGSIAGLVYAHLPGPKTLARSLAASALLAGLVVTAYDVRNELKRTDYRAEANLWQVVGAWLGPQSETVALVDDYGGRLKYWGWTMPLIWPTADDLRWQAENGNRQDFAERFEQMVKGRDFFLVSPISELARQPELAQALSQHLVVFQASDIRIYNLKDD
jgi:hypothetical protein